MSESSINPIMEWLDNCSLHHANCRCDSKSTMSERRIPTRLLDLQGNLSQTWSLVDTGENPAKYTKYIALSHRWTEDVPKLMEENSKRFHNGELDRILPHRYQVVLALCRKLSVRYIWIDSLCIFQDSPDDFRREAATMVDVYKGAFCNLSRK